MSWEIATELGPEYGPGFERHVTIPEENCGVLPTSSPPLTYREEECVKMLAYTLSCRFVPRLPSRQTCRFMATVRSSLPHEERTAAEPRENRLEPVILSHIRQVNDNVRLLRLNAADPDHAIKVRHTTDPASSIAAD